VQVVVVVVPTIATYLVVVAGVCRAVVYLSPTSESLLNTRSWYCVYDCMFICVHYLSFP
jgi:hypothetical protein